MTIIDREAHGVHVDEQRFEVGCPLCVDEQEAIPTVAADADWERPLRIARGAQPEPFDPLAAALALPEMVLFGYDLGVELPITTPEQFAAALRAALREQGWHLVNVETLAEFYREGHSDGIGYGHDLAPRCRHNAADEAAAILAALEATDD